MIVMAIPHFNVEAASPGDLIKGSSSAAVYYVTADNKRLAFPNEAVYFSWYKDFSGVQTISDTDLAALPLAGLITIRPGTKIVKFETDPKIYAVAHGGTLRALTTDDIAQIIFGADWANKVVVVPDAFLTSYKFGIDITGPGQYWWSKESVASPTIADDLDPSKSPDATAPPAASSPVTTPPPTASSPVTTPPPAASSPVTTPAVATGPTIKNILFILWDPKRPQDAAPDKTALERVVFGAAPSVADYYKTESNNQVQLVNAGILGWYSADYPPDHYWSDDPIVHESDGYLTGAAERVAEAVKKASADFDFKKYDTNGDGKITPDELAIIVVTPQSGDPSDDIANVYSNETDQTPLTVDGVTISSVGEAYIGAPLGEAPEFGAVTHCIAKLVFSLPDAPSSDGAFSLLSDPYTDLQIDPYNRVQLGWLTPKVIPQVQEESYQTLPSIETSHVVLRIDRDQPDGPAVGTEYFLIENRERGDYDNSLPDTGLAVWDVYGGTATLVRLDNNSPLDDTRALWHLSSDPTAFISQELHWVSDGARSGVRFLNLGSPATVMGFDLEKKILTVQDLAPIPAPIQ
jgi:M6 family metalloprotease-like protein